MFPCKPECYAIAFDPLRPDFPVVTDFHGFTLGQTSDQVCPEVTYFSGDLDHRKDKEHTP